MQDRIRVELIFPRSGQVLPIYVPETMLEWVARRNLEVLLSLYGRGPRKLHADYLKSGYLRPS
jgi:hypothetical protein